MNFIFSANAYNIFSIIRFNASRVPNSGLGLLVKELNKFIFAEL